VAQADAGWHRGDGGGLPVTKEVVTPTMDALVNEGIELNRHYVHMMCTPTRSSFQSGRLPIHVLTQLSSPCDKNGAIPRNMTGIAAQLKKAGYSTHQVGKWDCGMATPHHTPHGRGYDTSLNYFDHGNWMWTEAAWGGSYNHRGDIPLPEETIIDFWDTDKPARTLNGTGYEEYLFRDRMTEIISAHDASTPLFLNYDSKVAHYPQQAPQEYQERFAFITDSVNRRMYHAMVTCLDDNLKNVTTQLKDKGMWENTLMVLSSDNGGYVKDYNGGCNTSTGFGGADSTDSGHGGACFNGEAGANNFPLRAGKYAMFEGGIRVNAFVSGGFLPASVRGTKLDSMIHIVDWYMTFAKLAGLEKVEDPWAAASGLPPIDSLDVWPLVSGATETSPRTEILVNANLLVTTRWKYVRPNQTMIEASWGGAQYPNGSTISEENWIANYNLHCGMTGCLFDLETDYTEQEEVAAANPAVVEQMMERMEELTATIWSPEGGHGNDPKCHSFCEEHYGGFYGPWKELEAWAEVKAQYVSGAAK
jgi:arylsulfatase A-like enzyme